MAIRACMHVVEIYPSSVKTDHSQHWYLERPEEKAREGQQDNSQDCPSGMVEVEMLRQQATRGGVAVFNKWRPSTCSGSGFSSAAGGTSWQGTEAGAVPANEEHRTILKKVASFCACAA
jgi:hypothetical protein